MTPAICPKSGQPAHDIEIDDEGITICPGCARPVLIAGGRIRDHRLPGQAA